ncbi:TIGR00645 family protein [Cryobacterium sp. SO2]|uniref:TIGR00645 family protein n=1 Tax=Cryobacterium sp. SO2 TaxID=1897060 RepID=UPI0023DAD12E|nr:TIGR00645 family protein [Cryobacterium sp. SO2]WEO78804.1 TIGR00645 family protein [Cryobacterium sp. SO2]
MSTPQPRPRSARALALEHASEVFLFSSRWLLAPLYIGMVVALVAIAIKFFQELWHLISHVVSASADDLVLSVLALLDLALLGNLVIIVIFAGYENFVSKIAVARNAEDRPTWMGHIDFSGLKMKLIGSIVAISAIGLLQDFTEVGKFTPEEQFWRLMLHLTFLLSGVGFAFMDWLGEKRLILAKISHSEDN